MIVPIESLSIPPLILRGLRERGIEKLTPPQAEAIKRGLFEGRNIVVSTPTASGKTLIAEMALVHAATRGLMGIYATPLKALANEKYDEFRFWERYGIRVGITTGDYEEPGEWLGKYDIVVATYERLDSILRNKPSWIRRLDTIVIDELHNVGDPERGPIVELIATRALYMGVQIVGLSATIGNPETLAKWLGAELISCEWRPVKLVEGYYDRLRREIVFSDGRIEEVRHDLVTHIVLKAMEEDYQVLIFKQSRRHAESLAERIAPMVRKFLEPQEIRELETLVHKLRESTPSRVEFETLSKLLEHGVAFHHAGLSLASRRVVEEGFRKRLVKIVVATPTLAAGINMPARRVLIYTKRYESGRLRPIPVAEYKQMAGRAGRPGFDPYGEAIIADAPNERAARSYIEGSPEPVESQLWSPRALRIHLLASIASGYVRNYRDILEFFSKTLGASGARIIIAQSLIRTTLESLSRMGMLTKESGEYRPTELGTLVSRLYIDPLTAHLIIEILRDRPASELSELFYLTTIAMTPDFERVRVTRYKELIQEAQALADAGEIPPPPSELEVEIDDFAWLRAVKIAMILHSWINEVEEDKIIELYGIGMGDLANIIDTATWLIHAASRVCSTAGLSDHARELEVLTLRVEKGVKRDVVELAKIRGVGRVRARALYNAGYRTIEDVARADPRRLSAIPSIGPRIAEEIIKSARELLARR